MVFKHNSATEILFWRKYNTTLTLLDRQYTSGYLMYTQYSVSKYMPDIYFSMLMRKSVVDKKFVDKKITQIYGNSKKRI
jgi:hypothetical protein